MRWSRFVPIVLLALVLLVASACGGGGVSTPTPTPIAPTTPTPTAAPTSTPMAGYETYTDEVYGFSISYPEDWYEVEVPEGGLWEPILVAYWAPSPCATFFSNFNVLQEKMSSSMSVQDYGEWLKYYLVADGYTFISEEELTIGGRPAIKSVYTYTVYRPTTKLARAYLVEGKTAWVITCTISPECWNQYEPVFDTIINSFKLLD